MKKYVIYILVIFQFLIIIYLGFYIKEKKGWILGTNIAPISKEGITKAEKSSDSNLQNFYEPEAGKIMTESFGWAPKDFEYTINTDSLNERFDYSPEKPANTFRIVTLGDSFTFGSFVKTEENYSELLEIRLNDACNQNPSVEVINLGMGGYDIQYVTERYIERGE